MIEANVITYIKENTDLIELFKSYGHTITTTGQTTKTHCPFHKEKTPSLSINQKTNLWNCFGCNEGGDAITLIEKKEQCTFPEAVKKLKKIVGLEDDVSKTIEMPVAPLRGVPPLNPIMGTPVELND